MQIIILILTCSNLHALNCQILRVIRLCNTTHNKIPTYYRKCGKCLLDTWNLSELDLNGFQFVSPIAAGSDPHYRYPVWDKLNRILIGTPNQSTLPYRPRAIHSGFPNTICIIYSYGNNDGRNISHRSSTFTKTTCLQSLLAPHPSAHRVILGHLTLFICTVK